LLTRKRRPSAIASGRVTNHGREIADQKDHGVAEILELTHLIEYDRMAEVYIWRCWVKTKLDTQGHPGRVATSKLLSKLCFDEKLFTATLNNSQVRLNCRRNRIFCSRHNRSKRKNALKIGKKRVELAEIG
jgi:hypothetical protein